MNGCPKFHLPLWLTFLPVNKEIVPTDLEIKGDMQIRLVEKAVAGSLGIPTLDCFKVRALACSTKIELSNEGDQSNAISFQTSLW